MSFKLDDLAEPDSANVSLNINDDIISNHSQVSNYSNRNNLNKINQINNIKYNQHQLPQDSPPRIDKSQKSSTIK